jgi:hypothetical protein
MGRGNLLRDKVVNKSGFLMQDQGAEMHSNSIFLFQSIHPYFAYFVLKGGIRESEGLERLVAASSISTRGAGMAG